MFKKECETGSYKKALKQAKTPEQVAEVEKYQEAGRVAWMEYHAACGETSAALKYAVTDEEEEKCKQALASPLPSPPRPSPPSGTAPSPVRRDPPTGWHRQVRVEPQGVARVLHREGRLQEGGGGVR